MTASDLAPSDVLARRMRAQRLSHPTSDLTDLLDSVFALQAQDVPALRLAARARGVEDLDGRVVRTWAMRGTLHLIARDDLWVLELLKPSVLASTRNRRDQLGLTDDLCERGVRALCEVLTEPLTRAEVVERLAEVGLPLDPGSQAPAHLLLYAAVSGFLCRGLDDRYRLLDDVPPADRTVDDLWRRYRRAYGPATVADFAAWSGLPKRQLRDLPEILAERADPDRTVRMLGHFDPYLLGYRDRSLALAPEFAPRVQTGGGFLTPHVVVAGEVVATWRKTPTGFAVSPFDERPDLREEAERVARFLGTGAALTWR
ncbi:winged helix DNA-binding domain-containing protein [Actinosynnema sp. NPDC023587]|uniref:winged helix DNA-binding domain-containing protein n=1 Tax=Actinosynnema sp. NPDC023587 TaxID=3154695 RepID=UPI0033F2F25A